MTDIFNPWADKSVGGFSVPASCSGAALRRGGLGYAGRHAAGGPRPAQRLRSLTPTTTSNELAPGVLPARRQVLTQLLTS